MLYIATEIWLNTNSFVIFLSHIGCPSCFMFCHGENDTVDHTFLIFWKIKWYFSDIPESFNFLLIGIDSLDELNDFISLKGLNASRRSFCSRKCCVCLWRCDVMAFKSLTLTPFCMEILGVRKWIFQCFNSVFSAILIGIRLKYARTRPLSLFLQLFCRYSLFFSRARSTAGEGGTGKYQPWYQPPYQPSTWLLDPRAGQLYLTGLIRLGQKSSIKGAISRDNPKSAYAISSFPANWLSACRDDNRKSCILDGERLSCRARDIDH